MWAIMFLGWGNILPSVFHPLLRLLFFPPMWLDQRFLKIYADKDLFAIFLLFSAYCCLVGFGLGCAVGLAIRILRRHRTSNWHGN